MNIVVKTDISFMGDAVCVVFDGLCNHAETKTESIDCGGPDRELGDYRDDWRNAEVCTKCGAIYNEYDQEWSEGNT